jgi:AAA+ superfamily predicted ATPase
MTEKSFSTYEYTTPIATAKPRWSTDASALMWGVGGYSAARLPAGVYSVKSPWDSPPYLYRLQVNGDKLFNLPDDPSTAVLNHILDFWDKEAAFKELGVVYKRGILLYGPPGSGKSVTIFRLVEKLEQNDAIMIIAHEVDHAKIGISIVKQLEPTRKIVVVFEDIDGIIRHGDESMTHLLDGETDVSNVLFIATTNYPERLPERLLNRPSRFDVVIQVGLPSEQARRYYITNVVKNLLIDIDELVAATDGLTFAQIKEAIILVQIFDHTIEQAIDKLTRPRIKEM